MLKETMLTAELAQVKKRITELDLLARIYSFVSDDGETSQLTFNDVHYTYEVFNDKAQSGFTRSDCTWMYLQYL